MYHTAMRVQYCTYKYCTVIQTHNQHILLYAFTANIIVAEKVARLDPNSAMDFFRHYKVCFWITLISCATGALVITLEFQLERLIMGN